MSRFNHHIVSRNLRSAPVITVCFALLTGVTWCPVPIMWWPAPYQNGENQHGLVCALNNFLCDKLHRVKILLSISRSKLRMAWSSRGSGRKADTGGNCVTDNGSLREGNSRHSKTWYKSVYLDHWMFERSSQHQWDCISTGHRAWCNFQV